MDYFERLEKLKYKLNIDQKKKELSLIKEKLADSNVWQNEAELKNLSQEQKRLASEISEFEELMELFEIADEGERDGLAVKLEELEKLTYFSGKHDADNAILQIYSGAGGVDAQDWAEMLLKMYLKYCEKSDLTTELVDITQGNEAGIKNATLIISGSYAYGRVKSENGVHRLVRQSPFNSKNLRQTSFALVEIVPEIRNESNFEINDRDLKIDVFRASGHGGQSVNTTDSAVRITHLPTGMAVICQNQRSQLQNKNTALLILKSRLGELMEKEQKANLNEIRGERSSNEWGSQIRSYVLHPYKLVKDHRTNYETSSVDAVLGGNLEGFVDSYLKAQDSFT